MRLAIVHGALDRVHAHTCHHAQRAITAGRTTRVQGKKADVLIKVLREAGVGNVYLSDGKLGLPKGYLTTCGTCRPERSNQ